MNVRDATSWLRRPEYTGENRCTPCTVVNLCLGGVLAGIVAAVWAPLPGAAVFAVCGTIIYLRGYLVPGTPTLTKRYFPAWALRWFGKEPIRGDATTPAAAAGPVAEQLFTNGVLTRDGDEVGLTERFRSDWREQIATVTDRGVESADLKVLFDADSVTRHGDRSVVVDGNKSVRWGSEAALAADVAADDLFRDRVPGWTTTAVDHRQSILQALRLCLEVCPDCGNSLAVDERRVDPCCEKPHLVAESVCDGCGAVFGDVAVVDRNETTSVRTELLQP
jgi:hypothetical protein